MPSGGAGDRASAAAVREPGEARATRSMDQGSAVAMMEAWTRRCVAAGYMGVALWHSRALVPPQLLAALQAMQADVEAALSPSLEAQVVELVPSWEDATAQPAVLAADGSQPPRHAPAADRSSPASSDDVATPPEAAPAGEATVAADEGPRTGVANVPAASEEHEASGGAATCDDATEERGVQPALLDAATSLDRRPHAADTLQGADAGAAESADAEIAHASAADHDDAAPADGNAAEATLPLPEA